MINAAADHFNVHKPASAACSGRVKMSGSHGPGRAQRSSPWSATPDALATDANWSYPAGWPGRCCPGWRIWRDGIVGCDGASAGLGWHNIPQHVITNLELHCFPEAWATQPPALPPLLGFLTGASQCVERGRPEEPLFTKHPAWVRCIFAQEFLNIGVADAKLAAHSAARPLSRPVVHKPPGQGKRLAQPAGPLLAGA